VAAYWGQDRTLAENQMDLGDYCKTGLIDRINLSNKGGYDSKNSGNTWGVFSTFGSGPSKIEQDVTLCQSLGVKVILTIGGGTADYGVPAGKGGDLATRFYNVFFSANTGTGAVPRPFGSAILDGIDLDLENQKGVQMQADYLAFVQKLKNLRSNLLIFGWFISWAPPSPQCPDSETLTNNKDFGNLLSQFVFDYVNIQFYNNPSCNVNTGGFFRSFAQVWSGLNQPKLTVGVAAAKNDVVVTPPNDEYYQGVPQSAAVLKNAISQVKSLSKFAGLAFWDVSGAYERQSGNISFLEDISRYAASA
ncbi:glycoside hydrolase superfamily, partial [Zopfochytrium polystomum]